MRIIKKASLKTQTWSNEWQAGPCICAAPILAQSCVKARPIARMAAGGGSAWRYAATCAQRSVRGAQWTRQSSYNS